MLVLTRKVGEEIVINDQIRVAVVLVRGNRVRLGVQAPPSVRIQRRELTTARAKQPSVPTRAACLR